MDARVATVKVKPGRMDEMIKIYDETQRSVNQGMQGFQSARLLTDRNANTAVAVTIWATESDARASVTPSAMEDVMVRFGEVCWQPAKVGHFRKGEIRGKWQYSWTP